MFYFFFFTTFFEDGEKKKDPYLLHPHGAYVVSVAVGEVHLGAHLLQLFPEGRHLPPHVLHPGEHVRQQAEEQGDVLRHQLGHHGLTHTLDQDLEGGGEGDG